MSNLLRSGRIIERILLAATAWVLFTVVPGTELMAQTSPHGKLSVACEKCHTANSWKEMLSPMKFDHAQTRFALKGQHTAVTCRQCHAALVFSGAATQCKDCHKDVHRGELGMSCERCHSSQSWLVPDMVQRHSQTRFSLLGAHMTAACEACHVNQQRNEYVGVRTECVSCHLPQYQATVAPPHRTSGLSTDCVQCHSVSALQWHGNFDHATSQFPLTGAHVSVPCIQCHVGNRFQGTPTQCVSCHQKDFSNTSNPKHVPGFSTDCVGCHRTTAWRPATFDHAKTNFPLTGAHMATPCLSCHVNGVYAGTPSQCVNCHQNDYTNTTNPKHSPGFSTNCIGCHQTTAWRPATFDHSKASFPLTGAHVATPCLSCHVNGVYSGTPSQCVSCHQKDYTNTTSPKHSPGLSTDCVGCHGTAAWRPSTFDHAKTKFQLTGAHVATPCLSCHVNGVYTGTPSQCVNCHQNDYTNTTNPKHSPGFSTNCVSCHQTTAWRPATFDHSKASFPLTGAHVATPCLSCHVNGVYSGTPSQCVSCHQKDYTNTTSPKHSPGLSTDCVGCHGTAVWKPATFDHSKTNFQLTGAHVQTACASCHVNGVYAGTPQTCSSCHLARYNATTNPAHATAGFPTDCQPCHSTTAWTPSTFQHDPLFPISAGSSHSPGRWSVCADCHTVATNFKTFSCITCHQHASSIVTPKHSGVRNYQYDSQACYSCHPRGRGG